MVEEAISYLLSHRGRWVAGWELADHLYRGVCSQDAVYVLMGRVRRSTPLPIESGPLGYRIGRVVRSEALCPRCGGQRVRYDEDEWVCYGCPGTGVVDLEVGRSASVGHRGGHAWTEEERELLRRLWIAPMSQAEIGETLQRSAASVRAEAAALGLGRKPYVRTSG